MKIAIIDSDKRQAREVEDALAYDDHRCHLFRDWGDFVSIFSEGRFDAIVINCRFRGAENLEVMKWLQGAKPIPVLVITSQPAEDDIIAWLDAGASDLIQQPTTAKAISARVKAISRRYSIAKPSQELTFGEYYFHPCGRAVFVGGELIPLTEKEFMLSLLLFRNSNTPISRDDIYDRILKYKSTASSRTVDTHVARIRKKMKLFPGGEFPLVSIYGKGYMIIQSINEAMPI